MKTRLHVSLAAVLYSVVAAGTGVCQDQPAVALPQGVKAVWDLSKAYHETTPTRERICINGLWQWQPVKEQGDQPPAGELGLFQGPRPLAEDNVEARRRVAATLPPPKLEGHEPVHGPSGLVSTRD